MKSQIVKKEEKASKEQKALLKLQDKLALARAKEEAKLKKEQEQREQKQRDKAKSLQNKQTLFLYIYKREINKIETKLFLWVYNNQSIKESLTHLTYKELYRDFLSKELDTGNIDEFQYERAIENKLNAIIEYNKEKPYLNMEKQLICGEELTVINLFESNSIKIMKHITPSKQGDITPLIELYDSFTDGRGKEFDSDVMLPIFKDANILKSNKLGLVLYGRKSTGKSLLFFIMKHVLGVGNSVETEFTNDSMKFNSYMKKKLFIYSNDSNILTPDIIKRLKKLVTEDTFTVEGKGVDQLPQYPFHAMFGISCEELPIELADANESKRFMFLQGSKEYEEDHYRLFTELMPAIKYHYENHPDLNKKELSNKDRIAKYSKVKDITGLSLPSLAKEVFINYVIDKVLNQDDIEDYIGSQGQIYIPVNKTVLNTLTAILRDEAGVEVFPYNTVHPFISIEELSKEMIKWDNVKFMNAGAKNNRTNKSMKRAVYCSPEILVGRAKEKHTAMVNDFGKEMPKEVDLVKEMGVDEEHEEKLWLSNLPEELQDSYYCIKKYYYTTKTGQELVNGIALLRKQVGECTTPDMISQIKEVSLKCFDELTLKTEKV